MALSLIRSTAAQALRFARHTPDRLLHARRRRRALESLRSGEPVRSVLFVCLGNINRSAYAAAVFERAIPDNQRETSTVRSAGFIGPDRPASELAQKVAGRRNIDLGSHRSRSLDPKELKATDLIVVMNTKQQRDIEQLIGTRSAQVVLLGDFDPEPIRSRTVPDPYGRPEHVFEEVFDRIDRCVAAMSAALWRLPRR